MGYKKGDIFNYAFPERETKKIEKTRVIKDEHPVVVLHTRQTPHKTVLVAPITEPKNLIAIDKVPANYVFLKKENYPMALTKDCYINLDHIMVIDEVELENIERNGMKVKGRLIEVDLYQVDFKLMLTYELQDFFKNEKALDNNEEIKAVIQHIDINIKKDIEHLLDKHNIEKQSDREDFLSIMDDLISIIQKYYVVEDAKEGIYLK
mgnify:CR=1 FL=1